MGSKALGSGSKVDAGAGLGGLTREATLLERKWSSVLRLSKRVCLVGKLVGCSGMCKSACLVGHDHILNMNSILMCEQNLELEKSNDDLRKELEDKANHVVGCAMYVCHGGCAMYVCRRGVSCCVFLHQSTVTGSPYWFKHCKLHAMHVNIANCMLCMCRGGRKSGPCVPSSSGVSLEAHKGAVHCVAFHPTLLCALCACVCGCVSVCASWLWMDYAFCG